MPTYEYRCQDGHTFDVFQKMSDDPVATCPECGRPAQRQISPGAGFLFKGEGFYITDYRSKDYKERAQAEKPGGSTKESAAKGGDAGGGAAGSESSSGGSTGSASGGSSGSTSRGSSGSASGSGASGSSGAGG